MHAQAFNVPIAMGAAILPSTERAFGVVAPFGATRTSRERSGYSVMNPAKTMRPSHSAGSPTSG